MQTSRATTLSTCLVALLSVVGNTAAEGPESKAAARWRERSRQNVHASRCTAMAFSPNGRLLATVGDAAGGNIKLWDATRGEEIAGWDGHKERVRALAFSPDNKLLATGGGAWDGPGEGKIWNVATREPATTFSVDGAGVLALDFSPDGKILTIGSGYYRDGRYAGGVTFYSMAESRSLGHPLQGHSGETPALQFSPDGNSLVTSTGFFDEQMQRTIWELKLWDAHNGRERAVVYSSSAERAESSIFRMWPVVFSHDGKKIAFGGRGPDGGVVRLYDVVTGGSVLLPGQQGMAWAMCFSADDKTLAVGDGEAAVVRLWDVDSVSPRGTLASFPGAIFSLHFSPGGSSLVAGGTEANGAAASGMMQWWVAAPR